MLKGYERKLIMIRTKDSSVFESAFFILRGSFCNKSSDGDIVSEANRILEESDTARKKRAVFKLKHIFISAGIGFAVGAMLLGAIWIAVSV